MARTISLLPACLIVTAAQLAASGDAGALVGSEPDVGHPAVGMLLVLEPGSPHGDWHLFCSGFLVHERVFITAGHCVQQAAAALESGAFEDARVSFEHAPFDRQVGNDPDASGWLEIEAIVDNPANPDWQDRDGILESWGTWHDQGAIILAEPVADIEPLRFPSAPGEVERLIEAQCASGLSGSAGACELSIVAYGVQDWPPSAPPNFRQILRLTFDGINELFIRSVAEPSDTCPGDSGGAVVLRTGGSAGEMAVAVSSSPLVAFDPADPSAPRCQAGGTLHYRLDTPASMEFLRGVIERAAR